MTRDLVMPHGPNQHLKGYWAYMTVPDAREAIVDAMPYARKTKREDDDRNELVETWS